MIQKYVKSSTPERHQGPKPFGGGPVRICSCPSCDVLYIEYVQYIHAQYSTCIKIAARTSLTVEIECMDFLFFFCMILVQYIPYSTISA